MSQPRQALQLAVAAESETISPPVAGAPDAAAPGRSPSQPRPHPRWRWPDWRQSAWSSMLAAVVFALAARLGYFAGSNFPLNDGGMFVAMSRDLLAGHFVLPTTTTYNFEGVPFAYPPVAFYVLAGLSALSGQDLVSLDRWLPLLANLGTVAVTALLARQLLRGWAMLLAPIIFGLIPRSYEWTIMGGGLTRSFGYLFAVACLVVAVPLFTRPTLRRGVACAVLAGLALATHLELGLFVAYSLGLLAVCRGPRRWRAVGITMVVGLGALALSAPWWATVLVREGAGPFLAASHTGEWSSLVQDLQGLQDFITPPELLLSMPATLGVLGVLLCLVRGQWLLPLWLLAIFVLNPRSAPTEAALPLAFLAAVGLADVVAPGVALAVARARETDPESSGVFEAARRWWRRRVWQTANGPLLVSGLGLALTLVFVSIVWPPQHPNRSALDALSPADQQAMQWVAQHTPADETFLVLTRGWTWEDDHVSEWFPDVARRHSVLTVQAMEWLPDQQYLRARCLYNQVRQLGSLQWGVSSVDQWASDRGVVYSDVYVSPSISGPLDWQPLIGSAQSAPDYTVSYNTDGVVILHRIQPIQPHWPASGALVVAQDCTSLSEQGGDAVQAWTNAYGPQAARMWVDARNAELNAPVGPLDRLRLLVFGDPSRAPLD